MYDLIICRGLTLTTPLPRVKISMSIIRLGDIGTRFLVVFKELDVHGVPQIVDISDATTKTVTLQDNEGTVKTKTASFLTDGTDGAIYYDTVADDLDVVGVWRIAGRVASEDYDHRTGFDTFEVQESIVE